MVLTGDGGDPLVSPTNQAASSGAFFPRPPEDLLLSIMKILRDRYLGKAVQDRLVKLICPGQHRIGYSCREPCLAVVCHSLIERAQVSHCNTQVKAGGGLSDG